MEPKKEENFTYRTLSEKEKKNLAILDLIKRKGPISRKDISATTDINIVSISNYIKEYISKELVADIGTEASTGGRPSELVELNKKGGCVIGLDVGETTITGVLTNFASDVIKRERGARPKGDDETLGAEIDKVIRNLMQASDKVKMIGLGVSEKEPLSIRKSIESKFGIETLAGSDAACAAFGEKMLNKELVDVENLLYIYSDIGCGMVIKGDVYFGHDYIPSTDARYLRPWSIELGILQTARREIEKGIGTKMVALAGGRLEGITKDVVIEAARENDEVASTIVQNAGMNLGVRIAYLVNLFSPETIVIGGGVEKAGDMILDPIRKIVHRLALGKQAEAVKIIPSRLGEDAVSLGAAALAVREMFLKA